MRNAFLIATFLLFLLSCKKDKFTSAPQLKYKSVNTKELRRGETLQFTLTFTDAEGDLTDKIIIRKVIRPCRTSTGGFIDSTQIPTFPTTRNQSGEIIVTYGYNAVNPECAPRNDTAVFKFVLKDKAQNKSDTAVSDPIIIFN